MSAGKPKIFVFCNSCSPDWHSMLAIAEDGHCLAGHACSHHGWAAHDMGIVEGGWKRELYAAHYPDGFEVEWVEKPLEHAALTLAFDRNAALAVEAAKTAKVTP